MNPVYMSRAKIWTHKIVFWCFLYQCANEDPLPKISHKDNHNTSQTPTPCQRTRSQILRSLTLFGAFFGAILRFVTDANSHLKNVGILFRKNIIQTASVNIEVRKWMRSSQEVATQWRISASTFPTTHFSGRGFLWSIVWEWTSRLRASSQEQIRNSEQAST